MNNYVIAPSSELKLLKVPIQIDEKNQLDFASLTSQYNYFNGLSGSIEADNFTYIRSDSVIRFPACIDDIIEYNYVMYKNDAFSNKWFYAFITKMEYISSEMTAISIKEDSFQTWMFDIEYKNSFIEREHVTDDTVGKNLIEEGLATGEYIVNNLDSTSTSEYAVVLATTIDLYHFLKGDTPLINTDFPIKEVGGVPSASFLTAFPINKQTQTTDECSGFNSTIVALAEAGQSSTITGVYVIPIDMLNMYVPQYSSHLEDRWDKLYYNYDDHKWYDNQQVLGGDWFCYLTDFKNYNSSITITKPTKIGTYTPRNNKLLTSQYNYLLVDNNGGNSSKYAYELFSTTNCVFNIYGVPTPGCSYRALPQSYNNLTDNNLEGITGAKLPIGSWDNDVYTNWLTQNGVNIAGHKLTATEAGLASAGIGTALTVGGLALGGLLTGGLGLAGAGLMGGALLAGGGQIFDVMKEDYQHSIVPPQAEGNLNAGDVNFSIGKLQFSFYKMSIREERAKAIDGYFDMFGYKVNTFKSISIHTRTNWNYIKTVECNLTGDIPQESLQTIKNMFNTGFTIWHSPTYFLDYSQPNTIIT